MQKRRVCVPIHSPAWKHYHLQGWITLWEDGTWVYLRQP